MKRNFFAPIRMRTDGSIYLDKQNRLRDGLAKLAAAVVLLIVFALLVVVAVIGPFSANAQQLDKTVAANAIGGPPAAKQSSEANDLSAVGRLSLSMPLEGRYTSGFGVRGNPFGRRSSEFHPGQDIAAPIGTAVRATADGEVVFSGWQHGYGNIVIVKHSEEVSTRYAHLSRRIVEMGALIKRGDEIGEVGTTGRSTGPHLHYEIRLNGTAIDPIAYLVR